MRKGIMAGALGTALLLGGCLQTVGLGGEPGPYDGRWVGRISLSYGERSCLRRMPLQGTVEHGQLKALTRHKGKDVTLSGWVGDDGVLQNGEVETFIIDRRTEMTGRFDGEEASGRWKTSSCEGQWNLRKVSNTVE
ncbi:hypothetical protein [Aestuariispira ectoiniformans]|uniref:hypothetical protein n=1 Tax=Aestuariispira ectoiniformans TaxID=2775080 RepID=UPI00223B698E|nr:hypothetical protein [Aestuariispira ectoiniformans]